nr:HAD hydrolase-like protein [Hyphomonas sp. Mor2]
MRFDFSGWTLVFDLDGTLVETAPDLHAALNHTLANVGLSPVPLDTVRMMIGDGAKAMIRKGLSHHGLPVDEEQVNTRLWPIFLEHYRANITRLSEPYESCLETLSNLRDAGATLAVCTNKAQALAELVLNGLQMDGFFSALIGGDMLGTKKPDGTHILETIRESGGDPAYAMMIGDAWTDERAARDAKLPFVFVSFGYGTLSNQPYDRLRSIDHWRDMPQALSELAFQT